MRATSGSLARCRGGGCHPPYLSWLWSNFWPENQVFLQAGINSNSFGWFSDFFSKIHKKIGENWKPTKKLLKMSENSKFCNFWAISTCNTSKESIFLIEFNFTEKKYDLFENFLKKSNFSDFFFKTDADHLSSFANFSKLCQKISKLSLSVLWRGFEIKSQQRRTHYL